MSNQDRLLSNEELRNALYDAMEYKQAKAEFVRPATVIPRSENVDKVIELFNTQKRLAVESVKNKSEHILHIKGEDDRIKAWKNIEV